MYKGPFNSITKLIFCKCAMIIGEIFPIIWNVIIFPDNSIGPSYFIVYMQLLMTTYSHILSHFFNNIGRYLDFISKFFRRSLMKQKHYYINIAASFGMYFT